MSRYHNVSAFVLAGGASRRMGRDKALLELGGVPLIVRTVRLLEPLVSSTAVVAPAEKYAWPGLRIVDDRWPGAGPLGGIVTALGTSFTDWNLILACDLPFLTAEWIDWLISRALNSSAQAIVPESKRGIEPLAAIYHRDCGPVFSAAFQQGARSVREALRHVPFDRVTGDEWLAVNSSDLLLQNVNTLKDFGEARRQVSNAATCVSRSRRG